MKRCDRCRFWIKDKEEDGDANCRRYPPTPFLRAAMNPITQEQGMVILAYWPKTRPELWCGKYRRKVRVIPFFRRLVNWVVGILLGRHGKVAWYGKIGFGTWPLAGRKIKVTSAPSPDRSEECLTKENSTNMLKNAVPNQKRSQN